MSPQPVGNAGPAGNTDPAVGPRAGEAPGGRGRFRLAGADLFPVAVSLLGAGLVLARSWTYGTGLAWDSINYFAVARNLLAGEGFTDFDGTPSTLWPPLYPLLLAAASLGVFDPAEVAGFVGVAVFGLTIFVTSRFLRERLASRFLRVWAPLALALSLPLAEYGWFARSEGLFTLLLVLSLIRADRHLRERRPADLAWSGAFAALAWLTRYPGAAIPAAIGLFLLCRRGAAAGARLRSAALFSAIAAAPMGLWLLRNTLRIGTLTGHARPVDYVWWELWRDLGSVLLSWARFDLSAGPLLAAAVVAGIFAALPRGLPARFPVRFPVRIPGTGREGEVPPSGGQTILLFGGFSFLYLGLLHAALMLGNSWNGIEARYLVPAYAPLLVAAALAFDRFLLRERERSALRRPVRERPRLPATLLAGALSLWLCGQAAPTARAVVRANSPDPENGFGADPWAGSETLRFLREHLSGEPRTYSNYPALVYFHSEGRGSYRPLPDGLNRLRERPGREPGEPGTPQERLLRWVEEEAEDGAAILWFTNWSEEPYRYAPPPALLVTPGIEPLAEVPDGFPDGTVLRVRRGAGEPVGNRYRAALDAILSGEAGAPAARSRFDFYPGESEIRYFRDPCAKDDLRARFFLHLTPESAAALPPERRLHGFDNLDFGFFEYGVRLEGKCLAIVPLPDYRIARLRTGQWSPGEGDLWEAALRPDRNRYRALRDSLLAGEAPPPAVRAAFDLRLAAGALTYFRAPCAPADTEPPFFLHLYPSDPARLPDSRRSRGFENRDFAFPEFGEHLPAGRSPELDPESDSEFGADASSDFPSDSPGGACLAIVPLPDYPMARIRTGQWTRAGGDLWTADFAPPGAP